ncbi:MAG: transcription antitermination factor NusB [Desulfovibrio sp.]|nr:transcription antitermination factor NusB [Desulfovibrio sp.]
MSSPKTASRHRSRQLAFQVLYGLSFSPAHDLDELKGIFCSSPGQAELHEDAAPVVPSGFAWELVEGVWKSSALLDEIIERFSRNWRISRMGRVELTLLRLAAFEMLFRTDIPSKATINEALELSRQFGEHKAGIFVNGILDAVAKALEKGDLMRPVFSSTSK